MLTQERLKELFYYDLETGLFTRLKTIGKCKIGSISGSLNKDGYIEIGIDYKQYLAHRLAFLYMTGVWPKDEVDHKDTIRDHNWWSNLRDANGSQNKQNQISCNIDNKTGYLGVTPYKNKFRAQIKVNGRQINLGTFKTPQQAHQKYLQAKRNLHEFNTL